MLERFSDDPRGYALQHYGPQGLMDFEAKQAKKTSRHLSRQLHKTLNIPHPPKREWTLNRLPLLPPDQDASWYDFGKIGVKAGAVAMSSVGREEIKLDMDLPETVPVAATNLVNYKQPFWIPDQYDFGIVVPRISDEVESGDTYHGLVGYEESGTDLPDFQIIGFRDLLHFGRAASILIARTEP